MKVKVWQVLLVVLAGFIVLMASLAGIEQSGYNRRVSEEQEVLRQCTYAHNERNGSSESQCALLQDKASVEFVCNQQNTGCWVEL